MFHAFSGCQKEAAPLGWLPTSLGYGGAVVLTWAALAANYSTEQMMDAVFTIGQYNLVSWALNSFGVPLDDFLPGARP